MDKSKSFLKQFLTRIVFIATFGFATTINVPSDQTTIQAGIDAASNGDTVLVAAGTYVENINFNGKSIALIGDSRESTIIDGNQSGSVIILENGVTPEINGFTIRNGLAYEGGGINSASAVPKLKNLIITNNQSQSHAGGILISSGEAELTNLIVKNNTAGENGGGIYLSGSTNTSQLSNVLVDNNSANGWGGGIYLFATQEIDLNYITISDNSSNSGGGALFMYYGADVNLSNSILWNNSPEEIHLYYSGEPSSINISYSIVKGGEADIHNTNILGSVTWGDGNSAVDPIFIDTSNSDYHLSDYSPAIGAGTTTGAPSTDIEGNPRPNPAGTNPDIGAYENPYGVPQYQPQVVNVPTDYSTIQAALTAANATDTVLVQPGTYTENIIWPETNGIKLISAGDSSNTIIDGGGVSSVIYINPQSATIDTTTLIQGFKITNGGNVTSGSGLYLYNSGLTLKNASFVNNNNISTSNTGTGGGGIFVISSTLIINAVIIIDNFAEYGAGMYGDNSDIYAEELFVSTNGSSGTPSSGGGAWINNSNVFFSNFTFINNFASHSGGLLLNNCAISLINGEITNNTAGSNSGGMRVWNSTGTITSTKVSNNSASGNYGGGIYLRRSAVNMSDLIVENNFSETKGGGIYIKDDRSDGLIPSLVNSKIINNSSNYGGGIFIADISNNPAIGGNIFFENYADYGGAISIDNSNLNLNDNGFYNNNALQGSAIHLYESSTAEMSLLTIIKNIDAIESAIYVEAGNLFTIHDSNIHNNGVGIQNDDNQNFINAINNYWGHSSGPYHPTQNSSGQGDSVNTSVNVDPWVTAPNTDAPPIPAQNTIVTGTGNDFISLNWDTSPLGDLAGYKLYYDSDSSGYPYANSVNVGTDTSYTLSGLSLGTTYYLAVTTYDTDGNESWYSNEVSGVTRVMQAQSLDIGGDEDLQHLITHTPAITFGYYDSMNETQTNYQIQVSENPNYDSATLWWDSGEVSGSDTSATYAGDQLDDGTTYYLRVKVGAGTFYSDWSTLTFRMNSTISMEDLNFDPDLGETSVYTEGFPTVSSSPGDSEGDSVFVYYMLSDNAGFSPLVDSALVYFDEAAGMADVTWQPTIDPLDNQQYWIKAKGYDGYEYGNESNTYSFMINSENDAPASFSAIYPVDSSEVSSTLPTLIWNISSDPDPLDTVRYMVQFGSTIPNLETFYTDTMTSYQFTTELEDNTDYFWRVIAEDLNGASTENNGSYQTFRVNTANDDPGIFSLISPDSGSVVLELPPLLVWSPTTDLDGDSVLFDIQLNGTSIGTTHHNYYFVDGLAEDMTYTWSVTATDNNGGSTQSGTWSFIVNTENVPPASFALLSPETETVFNTQSVFFEWETSTDPDPMDSVSYTLDVNTDTTHMHFEINTTSFTSEAFMDNRVYHWSVTAHDMNGGVIENIGGPRMFVINVENDPPTPSTLVAPLNESIQTDLTPNFYWTEADDPDPLDDVSYVLYYQEYDAILNLPLDTNAYTPEEDLLDNFSYSWYVHSIDLNGAESISETSQFYTDAFPEPPANFATVAPENEIEGIATEVEFVWEETDDPDPVEEIQYQLVYATDWQDSSTYVYSDLLEDTSLTVSLEDNSQYYWIVVAMDTDGFMVGSNDNTANTMVVGTLSIDGADIPEVFALHQNYPNPFNPTTKIRYDLPEDALVAINIYDLMGRSIKSLVKSNQSAGYRSIQWNATNNLGEPVSAGMYIYMIQAGEFTKTKKMVLLK